MNLEKYSVGRLDGEYAIQEADSEHVHIRYRTGWIPFLSGRQKPDEWIPKKSLEWKIGGKDTPYPEGLLLVRSYSIFRTMEDKKPYIAEIERQRFGYQLLKEQFDMAKEIIRTGNVTTLMEDWFKDTKEMIDTFSRAIPKTKEEPTLIMTPEEKKKMGETSGGRIIG